LEIAGEWSVGVWGEVAYAWVERATDLKFVAGPLLQILVRMECLALSIT
jgi:hypothetical protein